MAGDTSHIIQSLIANTCIASGKGVAAVITGSGAMLAETLHSFSDCGNQLLLLMGVKRAQKAPDALHPLGYGRVLYFWSFMVALMLFLGGGMFSMYEGIHKIQHPEKVEKVWLGLLILGGAILIEGWATYGNLKEMKKRRGDVPLFKYLRATKDSDLVVVFGENSAAVIGLVFAMGALGMAYVTKDGMWDGVGSLAIGGVLIGVAIFLATEVQSLLVGESADPIIEQGAREIASAHPRVDSVLNIITVQQGPGEVMVAMKLKLKDGMSGAELCEAVNDYERQLKVKCPSVKWIFVEPDLHA
jgi:cation diffusion facilitator family transporter